MSPSEQVESLQITMNENLNKNLPEKRARFTVKDKPYITWELKTLDKKKEGVC